ncbi:porin family protein [Algoriphagus confluentis]|uniref:Porin family protein n=1 Tax=Algoriphagus confluentis TaxID=1697556 RepID=A0ABQ6PJS4_9BACT|nr:porin family protein [Algoriphagus confluentis]
MNKILVFFFALFLSGTIHAQDLKFGLRGGPSFTTLGGEEGGDDSKFRVGFHLGGFVSLPLSDGIWFEPGIQYANKGAKSTEVGTATTVRNGYLDLPLLFKFQGGEKFYFLAGAQPSFLMSSAIILGDGDNKITIDGSDTRDLWKSSDFAAVVGFGLNLGTQMHLQTTYEHGFANISEISDDVFNRGFKLSVGRTF